MKLLRMINFSLRDAFKSVFRNFSLSLASITCITITLVIVAVSLILSANVENFSKKIREDVTMVVYVNNGATTEQVETIRQQIASLDNIATLDFKSKDMVKQEMQSSDEFLNSIMSEWSAEENPLKDTFLVTVKDIEKIKTTVTSIRSLENVNLVDYGEEMIDKLITVFKVIEKVSIGAVIALVAVTIFLIINTIKLTIYSRKREISIMRLVGASNFTIKNPFVFEGIILGLLGSILPVLAIIFGYNSVYTHFDGKAISPLITLIKPTPFVYYLSAIIVLMGIVVGMIGSYRAVKRYLKV